MGADTVGLKCGATREEADEWLALPRRRLGDALHRPVGLEHPAPGQGVPDEDLLEAVDASYAAVVAKLP